MRKAVSVLVCGAMLLGAASGAFSEEQNQFVPEGSGWESATCRINNYFLESHCYSRYDAVEGSFFRMRTVLADDEYIIIWTIIHLDGTVTEDQFRQVWS